MPNEHIDLSNLALLDIEPDFRYSLTISHYLFQKIKKHLKLLNALNLKESQSKWVLNAIRERLEAESVDDILRSKCRISVSIDIPTNDALNHRLEQFTKCGKSFSKKQWIVEAISEKLDKDEKAILNKLKSRLEN